MKTLKAKSNSLAFVVLRQTVSQALYEHVLQNDQDVRWMDAPPVLPVGAKVALMQGNPGDNGLCFMRVKLPAN
ncbi:MAG: hypothetical protein EXR98_04790 [Gemmataceae bacterium]|nr:hypothetical protein [Gemmataceae bacterium]